MAFFNKEPSFALSCDDVLLDGCPLHMDLHEGHDDIITSVSSRSDEFLKLRSSLLKCKSISLISYFLRELDVSKEARNLLREIPGSQKSINTIKCCLLDVLLNTGYNISAETSKRWRVRSRESVYSAPHGVDKISLFISSSSERTLFIDDYLAWKKLDFISTSLFNLVRAF